MALATLSRVSQGPVIRRGSFLIVTLVATDALGRKSETIELSDGSHLVAGIAIHHCVSADQRKAVLVFVDVVDRNLPTIRVVTKFAFGPIFPTMEIGVAVLTLIRSIGEVEISVAVPTCHSGMAPAKRKACLRMVELSLTSDRLPISCGMTVLARDVELSMRTTNRGRRT